MSYSVNLRTMSRKSTIGFGRYADMIVGNILKVDRDYIAWLYYCKDKISFLPDILEELEISGVFMIDKPGSQSKKFRIWRSTYYKDRQIERMANVKREQSRKKQEANSFKVKEKQRYSKGAMMKRNHGK